MEWFAALLLGLVVGSFLNVCIVRIPKGLSIVKPRSHCPQCKRPVAWFDNLPILSYAVLGGRCRGCRKRISLRYPSVEALTGAVSLLLVLKFGLTVEWGIYFAFASAIIVLSFIDLDERILPDPITINGIWLGVMAAAYLGQTWPVVTRLFLSLGWPLDPPWPALVTSLIGAAIGGGLLWGVGEVYYRLRHVEGMGFGDVKLMAMVGALLGPTLAVFTIMVGSIAGSIVGLLFIRATGRDNQYELPFGTFLGFAAIVAVLYGDPLVDAYLRIIS